MAGRPIQSNNWGGCLTTSEIKCPSDQLVMTVPYCERLAMNFAKTDNGVERIVPAPNQDE
jgi:hypothetical protein